MPQLDTSDWQVPENGRRNLKPEPIVIEGEASATIDDIPEEFREPEFPTDKATHRETPSLTFTDLAFGVARQLDHTRLFSPWDLMRQLAKSLPLNEFDLPAHIYRSDMLDLNWLRESIANIRDPKNFLPAEQSATTTYVSPAQSAATGSQDIQAHIDASLVTLDYEQGFPTFGTGTPFWSQLDWEPHDAYQAFSHYLELGGTRALHNMLAFPQEEVSQWYHTYYWPLRVRAFDLFRAVQANRQRIQRMMSVEETQYSRSTRILDTIDKAIQEAMNDPDELAKMGLTKLVDVFDKLSKIQRVAVGLPAAGPATDEQMLRAPTTQVILQQINSNTPSTPKDQSSEIDVLRDNPELLDDAQDLIIRSQMARPIND